MIDSEQFQGLCSTKPFVEEDWRKVRTSEVVMGAIGALMREADELQAGIGALDLSNPAQLQLAIQRQGVIEGIRYAVDFLTETEEEMQHG